MEGNKSILIIDDDKLTRRLIGFHLKNQNYNLLEAENASQALDILNSKNIDLVLCDVVMDGDLDGFEFCKKVRENEKFRAIPFIFVTSKSSAEDKNKALEAGGDDLIVKPINPSDFLLKIQSIIKRSDIYKNFGVKKNLEESFSEKEVNTAKVLLVDDDLSLLKIFSYNLSKAGFETKTANSVEEAMSVVKGYMPDIIVSDIMMPFIDGYGFRKLLLEDNELKSIPFIFLTSKGTEEDILDGYDLGITDYVIKTQGPRVVVAKVSAIIKSLGKERQKVVTELNQAADSLRVKVVPDSYPVFDGFDIKHWHHPYQGIPGGDFLDYFVLDENNIAIILGDVMGKKWGAWYFAFAYAGYVRSALRGVLQNAKVYSAADIMNQVNTSVYKDAKVSEIFTTLSLLIINNKTKEVKYSGAGDLPVIFYSQTTGEIRKIKSQGMLLGFSDFGGYDDISITLNSGECLFLLTDGIIETRGENGEQFGTTEMNLVIAGLPKEEDILSAFQKGFDNFTHKKYEDDISLITIKCK